MTTTAPELLVHCPTCRARPRFACVVLSAPELSAIGAEIGFFHEDRTAAARAWVPPARGFHPHGADGGLGRPDARDAVDDDEGEDLGGSYSCRACGSEREGCGCLCQTGPQRGSAHVFDRDGCIRCGAFPAPGRS